MAKRARKIIAVFMVLVMAFSVLPMTANAESSEEYMRVTKRDSYNKDGQFYACYTVENLTNLYLSVYGEYLDSSGRVIKTFNAQIVDVGYSDAWDFGMNFAGYPGGAYTFKLTVCVGYGDLGLNWYWTTNITRTVPEPAISFGDYETYYDSNGVLMHKVNVNCKNMKGERLYCKIYDEYGYLMDDWGSDTPVRKTNNEVGSFSWSGGWYSGETQPSGNYTFVVSNSANNTVIQKTIWLTIPQRGVG
jgi:hypothetical protein